MDDKNESVVEAAERDDEERYAERFVGKVIGGYFEVTEVIGAGGMGYVLKARDKTLGRDVAVKVLHRDLITRERMVSRFVSEAKTIARIEDKRNIVEVYAADTFRMEGDGREWPYFVMQFLPGQNLDDFMYEVGYINSERAYSLMAQVFDGLQVAHDAGVIHRDLKPANIRIVTSGRDPQIKLLDFGISRLLDTEGKSVSGLTKAGEFFGTPHVVSPEQIEGHLEKINAPSDLYSAGCILFALLTGRYPFEHDSLGQIITMHLRDDPPRPSQYVSEISPAIDEVVLRSLEKDPAKRFQSAVDFKLAFRRAVVGDNGRTQPLSIPPVYDLAAKERPATAANSMPTVPSQEIDLRERLSKEVGTAPTVASGQFGPPAPVDPDDIATRAIQTPVPGKGSKGFSLLNLALPVLVALLVVAAVMVFFPWERFFAKEPAPEEEAALIDKAEPPNTLLPGPAGSSAEADDEVVRAVGPDELKSWDRTVWDGLWEKKLLSKQGKSNCIRVRKPLENIVRHEPNFPDAHFYLAKCYDRVKKYRHLAPQHYKKFLQLAPGHEMAPEAREALK